MLGLDDPRVASVLARLHSAAKGDRVRFLALVPRLLVGWLAGKSFGESLPPAALKGCYIPVSREQGRLLYLTARAINARRIVEFGTSFAISTIYLAAAVRANGGGRVIGTEIEPEKHAKAVANIAESGLGNFAEVRLGDALQTLASVDAPVDMVLLDGWKDLYLPVLKLIAPALRRGTVVLADNIFTFRTDLEAYVAFVQNSTNGFESTTLRISDGMEYSVYRGAPSVGGASSAEEAGH